MTAILHRLPFLDRPDVIALRGTQVPVKPYQIIVWVSVTAAGVPEPETGCPRIPVILDTGSTFTFSIRERHLRLWAGIDPRYLTTLLAIEQGGRPIPVRDARLWLYPNRPGERDTFADQAPHRLEVSRGIAIYPDGMPGAPRLPLLGLRALTENRLHLKVNAERRRVSLRSRDWVTRLLWWG